MFELLDEALTGLLNDPAIKTPFPELFDANVDFGTPDKNFPYSQETLDLFLYETRENRELGDPVPIIERRNGISTRRRPPLRVDLAYVVTAWSQKTGTAKPAAGNP
jgi:hypothetical protein